jgi:hypothetical protein
MEPARKKITWMPQSHLEAHCFDGWPMLHWSMAIKKPPEYPQLSIAVLEDFFKVSFLKDIIKYNKDILGPWL